MANSEELLVLERPESWNLEDDAHMYLDDREMNIVDMDHDKEYVLQNSEEPHLINQAKLNVLV
jgi:hypothetical protein